MARRAALRIADAMGPAVLFCDEVEKALAGVGGQGDSGVATRLFGTLLTWLSDHTSNVFCIGTCNDISKLPPEFARAERFDGVFFLDLPNVAEKDSIWTLYRQHFAIPESQARPNTIRSRLWLDPNPDFSPPRTQRAQRMREQAVAATLS